MDGLLRALTFKTVAKLICEGEWPNIKRFPIYRNWLVATFTLFVFTLNPETNEIKQD